MGADEAPRGGLEGEVVAPGGVEAWAERVRSACTGAVPATFTAWGERPTPWRAPSRLRSTAPWNPLEG